MREGETQTGQTPPERCSEKAWTRTRMACKMVESPVQYPAPCVCVCVCVCGRLDRKEMRRWVTAEITHMAHNEASMLLSQADKDQASLFITSLPL